MILIPATCFLPVLFPIPKEARHDQENAHVWILLRMIFMMRLEYYFYGDVYIYVIRSVHIQIQLCLLECLWIALFSKYLETLLIYWIRCQINTPWMMLRCKFIKENSVMGLQHSADATKKSEFFQLDLLRKTLMGHHPNAIKGIELRTDFDFVW